MIRAAGAVVPDAAGAGGFEAPELALVAAAEPHAAAVLAVPASAAAGEPPAAVGRVAPFAVVGAALAAFHLLRRAGHLGPDRVERAIPKASRTQS